MYGGLSSSALLRLLAVVAILLLVFGREVGAARAILVVLAVIIVCACKCGDGAGIAAAGMGPYGVMGPYGAGYGAAAYGPGYSDGF